MTFYVRVSPPNGRVEYYNFVCKLHERGYKKVEYYGSRWSDKEPTGVWPHLKFLEEEDALAYVLAFGGVVGKTVPLCQKEGDN